jgi:hypothetical protein
MTLQVHAGKHDAGSLAVGQTVSIAWEDRAGSYGQVPVIISGGSVAVSQVATAVVE